MKYLNETEEGINWKDKHCLNNSIFEYSIKNSDYYLNYRMVWEEITGEFFVFKVGKETIEIPSGMFVMIGEVYGDIDWVTPDEMIGRPLDFLIITDDFRSWKIETPEFLGVKEDKILWPKTKNIVPVAKNDYIFLFSRKDYYNKMKNDTIASLVV